MEGSRVELSEPVAGTDQSWPYGHAARTMPVMMGPCTATVHESPPVWPPGMSTEHLCRWDVQWLPVLPRDAGCGKVMGGPRLWSLHVCQPWTLEREACLSL